MLPLIRGEMQANWKQTNVLLIEYYFRIIHACHCYSAIASNSSSYCFEPTLHQATSRTICARDACNLSNSIAPKWPTGANNFQFSFIALIHFSNGCSISTCVSSEQWTCTRCSVAFDWHLPVYAIANWSSAIAKWVPCAQFAITLLCVRADVYLN